MLETQSSEIQGTGEVLIMQDGGKRITVYKYLTNNYVKEKERLILYKSIGICNTTQRALAGVAQLVKHCPMPLKVDGSCPHQSTCPACRCGLQSGCKREKTLSVSKFDDNIRKKKGLIKDEKDIFRLSYKSKTLK